MIFKYNNIISMSGYEVFVLDISKGHLIFQLSIQKDGKLIKIGLDDIDFNKDRVNNPGWIRYIQVDPNGKVSFHNDFSPIEQQIGRSKKPVNNKITIFDPDSPPKKYEGDIMFNDTLNEYRFIKSCETCQLTKFVNKLSNETLQSFILTTDYFKKLYIPRGETIFSIPKYLGLSSDQLPVNYLLNGPGDNYVLYLKHNEEDIDDDEDIPMDINDNPIYNKTNCKYYVVVVENNSGIRSIRIIEINYIQSYENRSSKNYEEYTLGGIAYNSEQFEYNDTTFHTYEEKKKHNKEFDEKKWKKIPGEVEDSFSTHYFSYKDLSKSKNDEGDSEGKIIFNSDKSEYDPVEVEKSDIISKFLGNYTLEQLNNFWENQGRTITNCKRVNMDGGGKKRKKRKIKSRRKKGKSRKKNIKRRKSKKHNKKKY